MVKCDICGVCCRIFYVPLTEEEFFSGRFKIMFKDFSDVSFKEIEENGWNLLERDNSGCVYLKDNKCLIHASKPKHCRDFFCKDVNANKAMVEEIILRKNNKNL